MYDHGNWLFAALFMNTFGNHVGLFVYDDYTNYLKHGNSNQAFLACKCISSINITRLYD